MKKALKFLAQIRKKESLENLTFTRHTGGKRSKGKKAIKQLNEFV